MLSTRLSRSSDSRTTRVRRAGSRDQRVNRRLTSAVAVGAMAAGALMAIPALGAWAAPTGGIGSTSINQTLTADTFSRITARGWGRATVGGAYTVEDDSLFSADGDSGKISLRSPGVGGAAVLGDVSVNDAEAEFTFSVSSLPRTGAGISLAAQLRGRAGSLYEGVVRIAPGGIVSIALQRQEGSPRNLTALAAETPLPLRISVGAPYTLRVHVSGSDPVQLAARLTAASEQGPVGWQVEASDYSNTRLRNGGAPAVSAYVSRSSQPTTVDIDNVIVQSVDINQGPPVAVPTGSLTPTPTASPSPQPSPTPTPATSVPSSSPPVPPASPPRSSIALGTTGAPRVGTARYPVPAGAIFASPNGSDNSAGTMSAPLRTVRSAVAKTRAGGTIVLRAGTYHESVSVDSRTVTIQNYPGEAVWMDGSSVVSGFRPYSPGVWVMDGWTVRFDASASYTFGASDGNTADWTFVNPAHPMAAHPDQVWIDGTALRQVRSADQVVSGSFAVDYQSRRLFIGADPSGRQVRASDLSKALSIRTAGSVLRGIGVTRYAPSIPHIGAVTAERSGIRVQDVVISDSATIGLGITEPNITLDHVTVQRAGLLGIHVSTADGVRLLDVFSADNNTENFNMSPVSGGVKITRTRGVTVDHGTFESNEGPGLWVDESVYDSKISSSVFRGNRNHGVSLEISALAKVVNNLFVGNFANGIKINNTSDVALWNNTFVSNGRPVWIAQDERRGAKLSDPGHDPRQRLPDPTMTWINGPVTMRNNVFSGATSSNCLICVEDYSGQYTAEQMRVTGQADVYQRTSSSRPTAVVVWSRGAGNPARFSLLSAFTAASGQETRGIALDGTPAVDSGFRLTEKLKAASGVAEPLPADLAGLIGQQTGTRYLGAFL